jgi:hypothetical protein
MLPFRAEVRVSACASDLVVPADDMHQAANFSHGLHVYVDEVWRCSGVTVDARVCIFAFLALPSRPPKLHTVQRSINKVQGVRFNSIVVSDQADLFRVPVF